MTETGNHIKHFYPTQRMPSSGIYTRYNLISYLVCRFINSTRIQSLLCNQHGNKNCQYWFEFHTCINNTKS